MKRLAAATLIAVFLAPNMAWAQTIDFRTATCKDFIALPEDAADLAATWLDGFMSDEEDAETMSVDLSGTDAADIKAYCEKNLATKLVQAVESME